MTKIRSIDPVKALLPGLMLAFLLALAAINGAHAQTAAEDPDGARKFIEDLSEEALSAWTNPSLSKEKQVETFRELMFQGFDITTISKLVLGSHYRKASPELREEYEQVFPRYVIAEFTSRIGDYEDESIKVTGTAPAGRRDIFVRSTIDRPASAPAQADWRIRITNGEFKIIDVKFEGVSLVVTFREQFDGKVQEIGLDGLLAELKGKLDKATAEI